MYRYYAKDLFLEYARYCTDKEWLTNQLFKLNRDDDFGVRDAVVDCTAEYLPEPNIRTLIGMFLKAAGNESNEYGKRHWYLLVESLARQIRDARLFEQTRIISWGEPSTAACVDIAGVYLECGDTRTALSWLERIPPSETYQSRERDQLLLVIHGQLGQTEKQVEVAWRIFRRFRSKGTLAELLSIIGVDRCESVTNGEVKAILDNKTLSLPDAAFLVELGRMDEAESYLLEREDQLNGDFYGSLLPLAEAMENDGRHLVATMVFRTLLDSILRRGQAKTYTHGVRYLRKLDQLAKSILDWRSLDNHDTYLQQLRQIHGRKTSFWSQYGN